MLGTKFARSVATAACAAAIALSSAPAMAQTEHERAGAQRDWSVFAVGEGAERVCWIVSKPKKWEARRGGARVDASRGDIYLMVANRPAQNVRDEVSLVVGYPLKPDSTVRLDIGSDSFALFVENDTAWSQPADDARVVASMKRGVEAVATGVSARGTTTIDTFSLLGFTAALDQAAALCK
ncbi:MAG: invasion associated locus B family protein [Rubrimonas sp.]|uniref:invasion associated locus B family protein n=1 Tax=Rubrimonas sp. TaxID=2036015 RepID=UPI002FDC89DC